MPFGKFKGKFINDMEESYIKEFVTMKKFKQNKQVRQYFRKTKFKDLLQSEKEYSDMKIPSLSSKSKKSKGSQKRTKRKRKKKMEFIYFYMNNCKYCKQFNPTWVKLIHKYKSILKLKKIDGPSHPNLLKKYNISHFPTLLLLANKPI
jgi:thiol-disulfide isomerase/thioredoxin